MYAKVDVTIIEEPGQDSIRFRYQSDDRQSGSIMGINSRATKPTFPSIRINTFDYVGPVIVIASCVTKDKPYKPHPHCLVGENCTKGVCRIDFVSNKTPKVLTYRNLGIECARHVDVENNLIEREKSNVDPFKTGFSHKNKKKDINMHEVRLCFQVLLTLDAKRLPVKPIVSSPIRNNLKALPDLVIYDISDVTSPVHGGKKILIFCDKVLKDDVEIRFFQEDDDKALIFEKSIAVQPRNIHRQYGISFYTPKYKCLDISDPVNVHIQLVRPSDDRRSEPLPFQYIPDIDIVSNHIINGKKRKIEESQELFLYLKQIGENQLDKTSVSPKVEAMSNIANDSDEKGMRILCENPSTLTSLYNDQLPSLNNKQNINQVDQSQENRQIFQIGANQPQPLASNHLKLVRHGRFNREIEHQSQQSCGFYQLNNIPPQPLCSKNVQQVDQSQQSPEMYTLSNNQPQSSYNNHFQQVEQNQQIHPVSTYISQPSQIQLVDQSQQNYELQQMSTDSIQSSCSKHVRRVDQSDQNFQLLQTNDNQPQPLYSNHLLVDRSQENSQICEMNKYQELPSFSNHFQELGASQQNCEIYQVYPPLDMPLNSNLRPPQVSCYDSPSEYPINRNFYHEIQINSPIASSQSQLLIHQYEQGLYPIQMPTNDCNNSQNLKIDEESVNSDFVLL